MSATPAEEGGTGGDVQPAVTSGVIASGNPVVHDGGYPGGQKQMTAAHAKESTMNRRDVLLSATLMAAGIAAPQAIAATADAGATDEKKAPARNVNEAVVRYLAAWNERDAPRRLELVAKAWTEDGSYIDRVRQGQGHNELDAMIAKAQARFPGYQLHLASGIEAHHDYVRFSWIAGGTNEAPLYIKGTDVAVLAEDGRMRSVIGFVDAAPVPVGS